MTYNTNCFFLQILCVALFIIIPLYFCKPLLNLTLTFKSQSFTSGGSVFQVEHSR